MVVQAHQPIDTGESETKPKQRKRNEGQLAHSHREFRVSVLVLSHRVTTEKEGRRDEEQEIDSVPNQEEIPIQIASLGIEDRIVTRRNVHQLKKLMPEKQDRQEKNGQHWEQQADVFQLPANDYRPFRVGSVVNDDPEEAADANCEEKGKGKQPRETELSRVNK